MALFGKLECRHILAGGRRTSLALEPLFWQAADQQAKDQGLSWQEWTTARLRQGAGSRASRLRVAILEAVIK
jgi:predicted DNA-binding ribbon-helix-helix protein